jgi:competence ComEA-like helix-hairpin-helix protein
MQKAGTSEKVTLLQTGGGQRQKPDATVLVFIVLALLILGAGVFSGRQLSHYRSSPQKQAESTDIYVWVSGLDELKDGLHRFSESELQTYSWGESLLAAIEKGDSPGSPVQAVRYDGKTFFPDSLPPVVANVFFQPIPINRAAEDVLVSLPGIGPKLAARIVKYREKHGPFGAKDELLQVTGIGPKKYEALAGLVVLD